MKNDDLKVESQFSFVMYACAKEAIKYYKPYLDEIGLTYTQYITMLVLWNEDNITVNDIGNRLYLDSGTVTPLLKKLESKGFVERIRDVNDQRNVLVKVTSKGYELKKHIGTILADIRQDTGIPADEANHIREHLLSVLHRLSPSNYNER